MKRNYSAEAKEEIIKVLTPLQSNVRTTRYIQLSIYLALVVASLVAGNFYPDFRFEAFIAVLGFCVLHSISINSDVVYQTLFINGAGDELYQGKVLERLDELTKALEAIANQRLDEGHQIRILRDIASKLDVLADR